MRRNTSRGSERGRTPTKPSMNILVAGTCPGRKPRRCSASTTSLGVAASEPLRRSTGRRRLLPVTVQTAGSPPGAEPAGDDVDPELPAQQLADDGPAAGHGLPSPTGHPCFQPTDAGPVVEQDAG